MRRGIYYFGRSLQHVWLSGRTILLLVIASAFLGYVLPWGQISFWGARVITSLIQAVPYLGTDIVMWLWGGFSVDNPTLTRFFTLHFVLPFVVRALSLVHIIFLHFTGSSNPLGLNSNLDKLEFHSYFSFKDLLGVLVFFIAFSRLVILYPWDLGDPENFIMANPLVTPVHIQPEWYFLFAYAILRSIPNKLGGVLALAFSVIILYLKPLLDCGSFRRSRNNVLFKFSFWMLAGSVVLLTWIGARPVEEPYVFVGQVFTVVYFLRYIFIPATAWLGTKVLK